MEKGCFSCGESGSILGGRYPTCPDAHSEKACHCNYYDHSIYDEDKYRNLKLYEIQGDLFKDNDFDYLMQCVSSDFGCGKGIAVQFNEFYDCKNQLMLAEPKGMERWDKSGAFSQITEYNGRKVINLITKRKYW